MLVVHPSNGCHLRMFEPGEPVETQAIPCVSGDTVGAGVTSRGDRILLAVDDVNDSAMPTAELTAAEGRLLLAQLTRCVLAAEAAERRPRRRRGTSQ